MSEVNNAQNINPQPILTIVGGFGIDGTGTLTKTLSMSGGTATGPGFSGTYYIDVPAGNIYSISASADDDVVVSGGGISAHSYWDATAKKIVPDSQTSPKIIFPAGAPNVRFIVTYLNKGGPYVLNVSVSSTRTEKIVPKAPDGDSTSSCKTCPCGNAIIYAYDAWRQLISSSAGTQFSYDDFGKITSVSDAAGTREFTYNTFGELETETCGNAWRERI